MATIYVAGILQGLALVTFPAAASVLTDPADYGLSSSAYGALFVPQAVAAVVGSLAGGSLAARLGLKRVLLVGLILDLVAMSLLVTSQVGMGEALGYAMLLLATTSLGAGFGLTVPSLNTYAAAFFADQVDRAVLLLNALLGLGTALAPVLAAVFLALDVWWGLPLCVGFGLLAVLIEAARLPLSVGGPGVAGATRPVRAWPLPPSARIFVGFALLYGIVETVNGNWATVYMTADVGASASAGHPGAGGLLGHGHRRSAALRRPRAMVAGDTRLRRAADRRGGRARDRGAPSAGQRGRGHPGLRALRVWAARSCYP